jgi:hypothetical protein
MKSLNLNSEIKVKLTDRGKEVYYHQFDELNKRYPNLPAIEPRMPEVDSDGYTTIQLWKFMNVFGKSMVMGCPNVIQPLNIYIEDDDLEDV